MIIGINHLKYVKMILVYFAYLMLIFIISIANNITESFLFLAGAGTFFRIIYLFLLAALIPISIVTPWVFVINFITCNI